LFAIRKKVRQRKGAPQQLRERRKKERKEKKKKTQENNRRKNKKPREKKPIAPRAAAKQPFSETDSGESPSWDRGAGGGAVQKIPLREDTRGCNLRDTV